MKQAVKKWVMVGLVGIVSLSMVLSLIIPFLQ